MEILGLCVMPNHFHLLLRPKTDAALSAYMQWVTCRYACKFRRQTGTLGDGHVFQRRFWSAPVVGEHHFLAVLRDIEANPVRANLVSRAEAWPWSSLSERFAANFGFLTAPPLQLPRDWRDLVNQGQSPDVVTAIRDAVSPKPGRPDRKSPRP